jgi:uncharacterized repeat protein (TIGR01451 family)
MGMGALLVMLATSLQAQVLFTHDSSGNLTSSLLTSGGTNAAPSSAPQGIKIGNELSLTVKVSGVIPTAYQWRLNGTNITGATNAMYYVPEAQATNAGSYSAVVTHTGGSVTSVVGNVSVLATKENLNGITYGGGKYVAVGENGAAVSSSDLVYWSLATTGTTNHLESVVYDGGKFVAVGNAGTVLTSADGLTWHSQSSGNTNWLKGIVYGNGRLVAAGTYGTTLSSTNGTNWTTHTTDYSHFEALTYGNSLFVAVGENGLIWRSTTGTNWTSYSYSTNLTLKAVGYNSAGFFVAAGNSGLILKSTNAQTWVVNSSSNRRNYEAVAQFDTSSVLLGPENKGFISGNGTAWGEISTSTTAILKSAIATNGVLLAVGTQGTIVAVPMNVVDHYEFASIASPQRVGQSFSVSVTAKDAAGATVSSASGTLALSAETLNQTSTTILGSVSHQTSAGAGTNTTGYIFTPNQDLEVTHLKHYYGQRITIWNNVAQPLAELAITNVAGSWAETSLPAPLRLKAGLTYLVSVTSVGAYYYRTDIASTFTDGTIDQGMVAGSDSFPGAPDYGRTFLVDFRYNVLRSVNASVSPSSLTLTSGSASGNPTISAGANSVVLRVTDSNGKQGVSSPILVQASDDLTLTMLANAEQVAVSNNLSFTLTVYNSGPGGSTGVYVTNTIPAGTTFVGASASQGSYSEGSGVVTFNVGSLASQATASLAVTVSSTNGSTLVTNTANVVRTEAESITTNNTATARSYFAPKIYVDTAAYGFLESNVGYKTNDVTVRLSSLSAVGVSFDYATQAGTAAAGSDYDDIKGTAYIPPGSNSLNFPVRIQGDIDVENNETFSFVISNPTNAFAALSSTSITVTNDDGISGKIHSLYWSNIVSPKRVGDAFSATITARDFFNSTVTSFTGTVDLMAVNIGATNSQKLLSFTNHTQASESGLFTYAYSFMPTNTIVVTHILNYSGTRVYLWTDTGKILASGNVNSTLGEWTTNRISPPVVLKAYSIYRLGFYSGSEPNFSRIDRPVTFSDGWIGGSYYGLGDAFPEIADSSQIRLIDLIYVKPASLTPTVSGNFSSGVWTGNLTLNEAGTNIVMIADDRDGHKGIANQVAAYVTNDMAAHISVSNSAPSVGSNLVYTVWAMNPGPASSTGVFLTNTIPDNVTFVSASVSQGSYSQSGNLIICDFGTVSSLTSATLALTVTPTLAGVAITNSAVVIRNEADSDTSNNQASLVLWPSFSVAQQLAEATETSGVTWTSSGHELWLSQTNTAYSGGSAAQSGPIVHNQFSNLRSVIRGPGTLSFRWKVSSESGADFLGYFTNGAPTTSTYIWGEVDWQQVTVNVPSGLFTNLWQYVKNGSINAGSDAGWVDNVIFTAPEVNLTSVTNATNGFTFSVVGTNGHRLIVQGTEDFYVWKPVNTNTISGTNFLFTDINSTNFSHRFYRTFHSHAP